jgi:hypothetical protein
MSELKRYKQMLKDNEAEIKRLTEANKHIKAHIKFLEAFEVEEETAEDHPVDSAGE